MTMAKVQRSVALFHHAQRNAHRECKDNYNTSQFRINAVRFTFVLQLGEDNICISNAQYYELSAQQNLWCEILEF